MSSRSVFFGFCLLAALAAVACQDDDGISGGNAGSSGKGNAGSSGHAGSSGKGNGQAGEESAGADNAGGSAGADDGAAGEGGEPPILDCTHLSDFVHAVIKDDTNAKSVPRPVNGVVFCDDPADPAAYSDLF